MANYHVNAKGEAGRCTAKNGGCPFGSEDHTEAGSIKEARVFAEKRNEERANENELESNKLAKESQSKSDKDFAAIKGYLGKKDSQKEVNALLAERKKIGNDAFIEKYDISSEDAVEEEPETTEKTVEEKKPAAKKNTPKKKASGLPKKVAIKDNAATILARIKEDKKTVGVSTADFVIDENLAENDKLVFTSYDKNGNPKKEEEYYVHEIFKNRSVSTDKGTYEVNISQVDTREDPIRLDDLYYENVDGKPVVHSVNDYDYDEPVLKGTFTMKDKSNELNSENENRKEAKPLIDEEGRESPYDVSPEIAKYTSNYNNNEGIQTKQVGKRVYDDNGERIGFVYSYYDYYGEHSYLIDTYNESEKDFDLEVNENLFELDDREYKTEKEAFDDLYYNAGGRGRWTKRQFEDVALPGL